MKIKPSKALLAAVAFAISGSVCAQEIEQPVNVNVDGLPAHVAARVKEKAKQGPTELRLYLDRTRAVHQLHYGSIAREDSLEAIAKRETDARIAVRLEEPRK